MATSRARFSAEGSSRASSSFPDRTWRSTRSASGSSEILSSVVVITRLIAAIVYWNTAYIEKAATHLRRERRLPDPTLLRHVSPLGWEHIVLTGDIARGVSVLLGERRPRASWVVSSQDLEPTDYSPQEKHPELYRYPHAIKTGPRLYKLIRKCQQEPQVSAPPQDQPASAVAADDERAAGWGCLVALTVFAVIALAFSR